MKLSADQVKHVAKLANLPLSEEEVEKYSQQLSGIVEYIEKINQADTKDVEATFNVTGLSDVTRQDEAGNSLSQEEALQNGSKIQDGYFVTKGVFDE